MPAHGNATLPVCLHSAIPMPSELQGSKHLAVSWVDLLSYPFGFNSFPPASCFRHISFEVSQFTTACLCCAQLPIANFSVYLSVHRHNESASLSGLPDRDVCFLDEPQYYRRGSSLLRSKIPESSSPDRRLAYRSSSSKHCSGLPLIRIQV